MRDVDNTTSQSERFGLKRDSSWKWEGPYSAEEAIQRVLDVGHDDEWQIAPFASEEQPVDFTRFKANPELFSQRRSARAERARREAEVKQSVPEPSALRWGKRGLGLFFASLLLGRATVSIFFPQLKGQGIPPMMWPVLFVLWTLGGVSVIACIAGSIQRNRQVKRALRQAGL